MTIEDEFLHQFSGAPENRMSWLEYQGMKKMLIQFSLFASERDWEGPGPETVHGVGGDYSSSFVECPNCFFVSQTYGAANYPARKCKNCGEISDHLSLIDADFISAQ